MSLGCACAGVTHYLRAHSFSLCDNIGGYAELMHGEMLKNDTSPKVLLTPALVFTIKYICLPRHVGYRWKYQVQLTRCLRRACAKLTRSFAMVMNDEKMKHCRKCTGGNTTSYAQIYATSMAYPLPKCYTIIPLRPRIPKPRQTTAWIHLFTVICTYHTCAYALTMLTQPVSGKTPYTTLRRPGFCLRQMFIWQGPNQNNSTRFLGSLMWQTYFPDESDFLPLSNKTNSYQELGQTILKLPSLPQVFDTSTKFLATASNYASTPTQSSKRPSPSLWLLFGYPTESQGGIEWFPGSPPRVPVVMAHMRLAWQQSDVPLESLERRCHSPDPGLWGSWKHREIPLGINDW